MAVFGRKNLVDAETKWFTEIVMDADITSHLEAKVVLQMLSHQALVWKQQLFFNYGVIKTRLVQRLFCNYGVIGTHLEQRLFCKYGVIKTHLEVKILLQLWSHQDSFRS